MTDNERAKELWNELQQVPNDDLLRAMAVASDEQTRQILRIRKIVDMAVGLWIIRELIGFVWFLLGF